MVVTVKRATVKSQKYESILYAEPTIFEAQKRKSDALHTYTGEWAQIHKCATKQEHKCAEVLERMSPKFWKEWIARAQNYECARLQVRETTIARD